MCQFHKLLISTLIKHFFEIPFSHYFNEIKQSHYFAAITWDTAILCLLIHFIERKPWGV